MILSIKSYDDLNEMHLDVLKEIGNIGSGNAASSLASMLDRTVDIGVPGVSILDYEIVADHLGGAEQLQVGLLFQLEGDLSGMIMFLIHKDFAEVLISELTGSQLEDNSEIGEFEQSALQEVGNIMAASYANAIADLTGLTINITVPSFAYDMVGAIMSVPAIYYANISEKIIYIEGEIDKGREEKTSHILLIPEVESLEKIMESLGLDE